MSSKTIFTLLTALLLAPLAMFHAADSKPSTAPRDDSVWLHEKGSLIFHDAFKRIVEADVLAAKDSK